MAHNYPQMAQKWARALWANLSLSRARSELRDWLTRPLLGSERRSNTLCYSVPGIYMLSAVCWSVKSWWCSRSFDGSVAVLEVLWWQLKEVFHAAAPPIVLVRAGFAGYGRSVTTCLESQINTLRCSHSAALLHSRSNSSGWTSVHWTLSYCLLDLMCCIWRHGISWNNLVQYCLAHLSVMAYLGTLWWFGVLGLCLVLQRSQVGDLVRELTRTNFLVPTDWHLCDLFVWCICFSVVLDSHLLWFSLTNQILIQNTNDGNQLILSTSSSLIFEPRSKSLNAGAVKYELFGDWKTLPVQTHRCQMQEKFPKESTLWLARACVIHIVYGVRTMSLSVTSSRSNTRANQSKN